jgi:hypothetical protein
LLEDEDGVLELEEDELDEPEDPPEEGVVEEP